jgi:radical SAM superfamily enzyme YgiQ (UPF0313 family)
MKILLIEPAKAFLSAAGEDVHVFESLALEYVAAGLTAHHDVKILDMRLDKDLQTVLGSFCPDVVGITSYTVHVNTVRRLFEKIKKWNPEVLTVVGGHHATVVPEDFLTPHIDLIVMGEGVFAFREVVARLEKGEGFGGIPGVVFAEGKGERGERGSDGQAGNGLIGTEAPPVTDLDVFPFPDRRVTAEYRPRYYAEWMKPLASIRTSKGCPFRCNFCALWKLTEGRYLRRRPAKIVEELGRIEEDFVFFADDESLVDAARMMRVAELIKEAGIKKRYYLYGRTDTISRNPRLLEAWKEIGLERVFVGFEFFRDEDLEYIKKGSTTGDNEKAAKVLRDLDLNIYASFIIRPEFRREDFAAFKKYCRTLDLDFAGFAMLTPFPGTDFYEEVKDRLITHNYDLFDLIHTVLPTTLPLKEFYKEYYRLYRGSVPPAKSFSLLGKYPWKEIPATIALSLRWYKRLRRLHLDHDVQ